MARDPRNARAGASPLCRGRRATPVTSAPPTPWRPATDGELTWLRVNRGLPIHPLPLQLTCEVAAFTFGLTQALRESFWPLYAVRARVTSGQLYLGAVPSPHAEEDLENRMRLMRETPLRYLRDLRGAWEREGEPEIRRYEATMAAFPPDGMDGAELGEALFLLRRARADQWCAVLRVVIC